MKRALNFFMVSLLLFTCQSQEKKTITGLFIENNHSGKAQVGEVFTSHRLIHLDATVNRIDDLLVDEQRIVVIDRSMESLYVFDQNGNLLKQIQGDLLNNGKFIQPICVALSKSGDLLFYEASNQMIFSIDDNNTVTAPKKSDFYIRKLYSYQSGFLAFKNQNIQSEEDEAYWFNVIETDQDFNFVRGHFPFQIEKNVARTWQYFDDPINVTNAGFEFYTPLSSTYQLVAHSGLEKEQAILFGDRTFKERYLEEVNREDPLEVLEKIFNRYALVNAKKLGSKDMTAVRYIDAGRVFYNMNVSGKEQINLSELTLSTNSGELPVPYPMIVQKNKWYSLLDLENYEAMNLPDYNDVHPILDKVIDGQTYLLELSL